MSDVQAVGAGNSAQYYPQQYNSSAYPAGEDVYSIPEYDETEVKRGSSISGIVTPIIGGLLLLGALWGGHKWGSHSANQELDKLKNSVAIKNYEPLKATFDGMKDAVKDLEKGAEKIKGENFHRDSTRDFVSTVQEKFVKPFNEAVEKMEKSAKEAADEAGDEAADAMERAAREAV